MKEHLKEVCICSEKLHYSHLLPMISAYEINAKQQEEFKECLEATIKMVKETDQPELINWGGYFDLLITSRRIHVIYMIKSFYLPE